jgi:hypothetical protein
MSGCCHNSEKTKSSKGKKSRLGWWLLGGFVIVGGMLWVFQENLPVNRLAPIVLVGLAVIWFVSLARQRMGLG